MLYADMVQWVLSRAKGCPEDEAIDAMRNACIEFCEKTYFLTEGTTTVFDGTDAPDIDLDRQVIDILEARIQGEDEPIPIYAMNDPDIDEMEEDDTALIFADPNHAEVIPTPTAEAPVTIEMLIAYAPGPTSNEVPDILWLRNSEALKNGALGRVLAVPGEAWSNDTKAAYHLGLFAAAITRVAGQTGRNRLTTSRRLRVKPV